MRTARGIALNAKSGVSIEGVKVSSKNFKYSDISSKSGYFKFKLPANTDSLMLTHSDYYVKTIKYRKSDARIKVKIQPISLDSADLPLLKNTISFMPFKLLSGGLAFRFERFIQIQHSMGAYILWYFRGRQMFGEEEFTGFKFAPHYRHYFIRNKSMGAYVQPSVIIAYYDFSKLNYQQEYDHETVVSAQEHFLTGGVGLAFGITDIVGNSKHFILDFNVGLQILPELYPSSISVDGIEYVHSNGWWYFGGPGSAIEFKFSIGGIF